MLAAAGFAESRALRLFGGLMAINIARRGAVGYDPLMEVSDVRRRLRGAIDEARRRTAERRAWSEQARRAYETLLAEVAVPTFHMLQTALSGEGHRFKVATPGEAVRLSLERSPDEMIELSLDTERDVPAVVLRPRAAAAGACQQRADRLRGSRHRAVDRRRHRSPRCCPS